MPFPYIILHVSRPDASPILVWRLSFFRVFRFMFHFLPPTGLLTLTVPIPHTHRERPAVIHALLRSAPHLRDTMQPCCRARCTSGFLQATPSRACQVSTFPSPFDPAFAGGLVVFSVTTTVCPWGFSSLAASFPWWAIALNIQLSFPSL